MKCIYIITCMQITNAVWTPSYLPHFVQVTKMPPRTQETPRGWPSMLPIVTETHACTSSRPMWPLHFCAYWMSIECLFRCTPPNHDKCHFLFKSHQTGHPPNTTHSLEWCGATMQSLLGLSLLKCRHRCPQNGLWQVCGLPGWAEQGFGPASACSMHGNIITCFLCTQHLSEVVGALGRLNTSL